MATTNINIIAKNKASAALGKVNRDVKKINNSATSLNSGFSRMRNLVLGVAAAVGGIKLAKGFLDAAVEVQNLGVQLKFITGSAEEGAKALGIVSKAAANSSFQLRDMAQAAPLLLTVADSTDELNELLGITGDIAAASGLTFVESAGQLQRAMSGGIAAADLFRERGIKSLLGFQEGVQFTAKETKEQIVTAFREGTTTIAGASIEMANTFTGQLSMISDKIFQFQTQVMDAKPFEFLQGIVEVVNTELAKNFGSIEVAASKIGNAVVDSAISVMIGSAKIIDALIPVFNTIKSGVNGILAVTDALPPTIKALGIIGFLMLGVKGKLIVLAIGLIVDKIKFIFNTVMETVVATARKIGSFADAMGLDGTAAKINGWADSVENKLESLGSSLEDFVHTIDDNAMDTVMPRIEEYFGLPDPSEYGPYEKSMRTFLDKVQKTLDDKRAAIQDAARAGILAQPVKPELQKPIDPLIENERKKAEALAQTMKVRKAALRFSNMADSTEAERQRKRITALDMEYAKRRKDAEELYSQEGLLGNEALDMRIAELDSKTRIQAWYTREVQKIYDEDKNNRIEAEKEQTKAVQDALRSRVTNLIDSLKTESEVEDERHQDALRDLKDYYGDRLRFDKEYQKHLEKETVRHEKRVASIRKSQVTDQFNIFKSGQFAQLDLSEMTNDQLVDFTKQAGMSVLSSMAQNNKKAFQIQKALNISMAIMNTARGVTSALATVPFPFNLAIAGLIGAAGAVQIGAIASQQYSGRRFGGPVSNNDSYIVGENGPELFTPGATGRITANEGMVGKGQTINFNITATDAKSVDELIVQRKPMIVNMIRQATQERGNRPAF